MWLVLALTVGAPAPVPDVDYSGEVTLVSDVFEGRFGSWALGTIPAGTVLVEIDEEAGRGDVILVEGTIRGEAGIGGGRHYRGVLDVESVIEIRPSRFLPHVAEKAIRAVVEERLAPYDPGRALLAGFLIGDTTRISDSDRNAMRRSGLSHFVAVSGSNVALFLGLLALVAGPLALGPRRRAVIGLLGLPIYAAATRFEPSVMRAAAMAAIALAGRLLGLVLEAWQLLAVAVVVLLVADPSLTDNVGFQLSVAATTGVLIGARWPVSGLLTRVLAVTVCAQVAVAPLLLVHFGSVPLLSPLINLVAAPLVTGATVLGAVGVAGLTPVLPLAAWLAGLVLSLARGAATWPQISGWQLALLVGLGVLARAVSALRPVVIVFGALYLVGTMLEFGSALPSETVVVLDVGQGDAILIHGGGGRYALVDGGPDPPALFDRLRDYGVTGLELVIATHVHADHVTGLSGLVGQIPIAEVWADPEPHETPAYVEFEASLAAIGLRPLAPRPGDRYQLGSLELIVEGPMRRYASPNDQSVVVMIRGSGRSMLLSGDIETFAQHDLSGLSAEVLKVPHQGAGTSDPEWLEAVGAETAIIPVGPNSFGHPVEWVITTLEESGARVMRTDVDGDVVIDLSRAAVHEGE